MRPIGHFRLPDRPSLVQWRSKNGLLQRVAQHQAGVPYSTSSGSSSALSTGPLGITARTFIDPQNAHRVGLLVETPDMDTFRKAMETEAAAEAMKFDGVRPETLVTVVES